MNNEPLELAREILAAPNSRLERDPRRADKALLLIDPFPNTLLFDLKYEPVPDLIKLAIELFKALKNQACFKPDELKLAADDNICSRFMIAPSRDSEEYPIACGSLSGFGGFLKRDFRSHDFFLGRRNAQKFLKDHFVLPESNPLFSDWKGNEGLIQAHCVKKEGVPSIKEGERLLPIIPLMRQAKSDCFKPNWPRYTSQDLSDLTERIERRADVVLDRLAHQYFKKNNVFIRAVARFVLGRKKHDIVEWARDKVVADLERMKLMHQ